MAYTSSNVAHIAGELITPTDLNRIEANIEDAVKRRYSQQTFLNTTIAMNTGAAFAIPIFFGFATNSTRVRISVTLSIVGAGANARWEHTFTKDGVTVTGDAVNGIASSSSVVGDWHNVCFDYVLTGLTVGAFSTWGVANYRGAGAGTASIKKFNFVVEEY